MTDKPNPVGLKKEISGHPTDHSRKALAQELALCLPPIVWEAVAARGLDVQKWQRALYAAFEETLNRAEPSAPPSLPEEGGQPDVTLCNKCGRPAWNGTIHVCQEAGASTPGDKTWTLEQLVDYVRSIEPPDAPELKGLTRQEPCAATMADKLLQK